MWSTRLPILKSSTLLKTKIHPPRLSISEIFPPSTPRLLDLCTSFFQKVHPPRLFQAPRLAIWQLLLHVY